MNAPLSTDHKLCPECGEPKLSTADGVLHCTSCGWSEEDDEPVQAWEDFVKRVTR